MDAYISPADWEQTLRGLKLGCSVPLPCLEPLWNVLSSSNGLCGFLPLPDDVERFIEAATNSLLGGPPALLSLGPPHSRGAVKMSDFFAIAALPKSNDRPS